MSDAYLIAGDPFLADEALDRLRGEKDFDPLAETVLDATASHAELLQAVGTGSLLGGQRLVVVNDAQDLKKEQVEALTSYLETPSPDATLVLVATGRTKLEAAVKKSGTVLALEAPKGRRLATWLRQRATEHKIKIDDRAAWALIDSVGTDLRPLDSALQQLASAHGEGSAVGQKEVRRSFPRLAEARSFAFTDAVGERRLPAAMSNLRRLLEQGDEPLALFGVLNAHLRRLLRARQVAGEGPRAVGELLGLPEWRARGVTDQALSYREEELIRAMSIMAEADIDMKGEFPSPEAALERAVIRIITAAD